MQDWLCEQLQICVGLMHEELDHAAGDYEKALHYDRLRARIIKWILE
jgi:hypothetical protein